MCKRIAAQPGSVCKTHEMSSASPWESPFDEVYGNAVFSIKLEAAGIKAGEIVAVSINGHEVDMSGASSAQSEGWGQLLYLVTAENAQLKGEKVIPDIQNLLDGMMHFIWISLCDFAFLMLLRDKINTVIRDMKTDAPGKPCGAIDFRHRRYGA